MRAREHLSQPKGRAMQTQHQHACTGPRARPAPATLAKAPASRVRAYALASLFVVVCLGVCSLWVWESRPRAYAHVHLCACASVLLCIHGLSALGSPGPPRHRSMSGSQACAPVLKQLGAASQGGAAAACRCVHTFPFQHRSQLELDVHRLHMQMRMSAHGWPRDRKRAHTARGCWPSPLLLLHPTPQQHTHVPPTQIKEGLGERKKRRPGFTPRPLVQAVLRHLTKKMNYVWEWWANYNKALKKAYWQAAILGNPPLPWTRCTQRRSPHYQLAGRVEGWHDSKAAQDRGQQVPAGPLVCTLTHNLA